MKVLISALLNSLTLPLFIRFHFSFYFFYCLFLPLSLPSLSIPPKLLLCNVEMRINVWAVMTRGFLETGRLEGDIPALLLVM
jgi:hypothetical protein